MKDTKCLIVLMGRFRVPVYLLRHSWPPKSLLVVPVYVAK